MSNIAYDKNKVEAFKSAFQEYQNAKQLFKTEIAQFQETIDFMNGSQSSSHANADNNVSGYMINKDGIMMKTQSSGIYDSSENTVIDIGGGTKAFLTDLDYNNNVPVDTTNKLYQVGLGDLTYDSTAENVFLYVYELI